MNVRITLIFPEIILILLRW